MGLIDDVLGWFGRHIANINYSVSAFSAVCGAFSLQEWTFITCIVATVITTVANLVYRHLSLKTLKKRLETKRGVYEEVNR